MKIRLWQQVVVNERSCIGDLHLGFHLNLLKGAEVGGIKLYLTVL
jgi:hypothetical protein